MEHGIVTEWDLCHNNTLAVPEHANTAQLNENCEFIRLEPDNEKL